MVGAAETIEADVIAYLSPFENHPAVERLARGRVLWEMTRRHCGEPEPRAVSIAVDATNRWLVKPRASGGGHGIRWWNPGDAVPAGSYVQPFADGVPGSIVFVAARGEVVPLGLTRQLVGEEAFGARGFRYCGNILTNGPYLASAVRAAQDASREFDLVGVNCIDFVCKMTSLSRSRSTRAGRRRWSSSSERSACRCSAPRRSVRDGRSSVVRPLERTWSASVLGKAIVFAVTMSPAPTLRPG